MRRAIGKKIRFEVFKRDSFTCQYCGSKAPDALLEIDHVEPVAEGGTNEIMNLVTACFPCNSGKGKRRLDDQSVLTKQRTQIEDLQVRREQIEMMLRWKSSLLDLDGEMEERLAQSWTEMASGFELNPRGRHDLGRMIREYGAEAVMEGMSIARDTYFKWIGQPPQLSQKSVEHGWTKLSGICHIRKLNETDPTASDTYRLNAMARKAFYNHKDWAAKPLIKEALESGLTFSEIRKIIRESSNFSRFEDDLRSAVTATNPPVNNTRERQDDSGRITLEVAWTDFVELMGWDHGPTEEAKYSLREPFTGESIRIYRRGKCVFELLLSSTGTWPEVAEATKQLDCVEGHGKHSLVVAGRGPLVYKGNLCFGGVVQYWEPELQGAGTGYVAGERLFSGHDSAHVQEYLRTYGPVTPIEIFSCLWCGCYTLGIDEDCTACSGVYLDDAVDEEGFPLEHHVGARTPVLLALWRDCCHPELDEQ